MRNRIVRAGLDAPIAGASGLLCLAATPVFAVMALATSGGDMPGMASPLNGMAAMYVLMSVFHSAPWLKLISNRRHAPQIQHTHHAHHT